MNSEPQDLRDNIAFLRLLAEGGGSDRTVLRSTGEAYVAGGVCYAAQCFAMSGAAFGFELSETATWLVSSLPTVLFLLVLGVIFRRHPEQSPGVAARALSAAFGAAGAATVAMLCVFVIEVWRRPSIETWQIFPCTVFALHGAAWFVAATLRRRTWLHVVAFGWLASAVALSASIGSPWYPVVAGAALALLMALPGMVMLRAHPD